MFGRNEVAKVTFTTSSIVFILGYGRNEDIDGRGSRCLAGHGATLVISFGGLGQRRVLF